MTEISIDQYVNLDERFASYDNDGYYIDSIMIPIMVADNLPYNISFSELKEFVKQVEVSIHQEELFMVIGWYFFDSWQCIGNTWMA